MYPEGGRSAESSRDDSDEEGDGRRRALEHLQRRSSGMGERELAARIAAGDEAVEDAPEEEVQDVHVALRHRDLPKAAAAGLVSWDERKGTVRPADEADRSEVEYRQLFADGWDDDAAVARDERRRTTLDVLTDADGALSIEKLATEVAVREADDEGAARETDDEPSPEDVDEVAVALYHRYLPKLADAGLVEYDADAGTVAYAGDAEPRWWDSPPAPPEPVDSGGPDRD